MTANQIRRVIPSQKRALSDAELIDLVQRQTVLYFLGRVHPSSGLARDSRGLHSDPKDDAVAVGGSGFGVMAIIVARKEDGLRGRTP
ncbi:hypothetical protein IYX23_01155 [Methylocystis sp. L43]|uniref:hypothetical protein n=1 Tax=Methylocystis TaxID=133 RepID=UPI0018A6B6E8|nr:MULTISPECIES: hypothetical protein [Methylocystis]MBG0796305.1 hypothetical protein [Methylocystis sp. L43]MBG0804252.1 hypothetical protein [Methylocystis sp. H15]